MSTTIGLAQQIDLELSSKSHCFTARNTTFKKAIRVGLEPTDLYYFQRKGYTFTIELPTNLTVKMTQVEKMGREPLKDEPPIMVEALTERDKHELRRLLNLGNAFKST